VTLQRIELLDPGLREQLDGDGFVPCDVLEPEDLARIFEVYRSTSAGVGSSFYQTLISTNVEYKRRVFEVASAVLAPRLERVMRGARLGIAQLAVKRANAADSAFTLHQDWSFVDEREVQPLSLWCPLTEVRPDGGALLVAPGSHRMSDRPRANCPVGSHYSPFSELFPVLLAKHMTQVRRSILYHGNLVHGSLPNLAGTDRVAFVAILVPQRSRLRHYWQKDVDTLEVFDVDEEFFIGEVRSGQRPQRTAIEERRVPRRASPFSEADFLRARAEFSPAPSAESAGA
jgi:hypothetical protein